MPWNTTQQWVRMNYDACSNLDESVGNYDEWEKPILKAYILYGSIYIKCLDDKIIEMENRLVVPRG